MPWVAGAVAVALIVGLATFYFVGSHHPSTARVVAQPRKTDNPAASRLNPESSYAIIRRSLAMVVSETSGEVSVGSAFCVRSSAGRSYFLTNRHVVGDAERVGLLLHGRRSIVEGDVLSIGSGRRDLAIVAVPVGRVPAVALATDRAVEGVSVAVAGFPSIQFRLAQSGLELSPSMHVGTVNAILGGGFYIEYDAQTDHGNSGGPLYDVATARVYGVVTYGIQSSSSLAVQNNLAIAIPSAREVIAQAVGAAAAPSAHSVPSDSDASAGGPPSGTLTSPAETVREFYRLLNESRYRNAYSLLSADFRRGTTYEQWRAGYATTVRSTATVEDSDDPSDVHVHLVATDDKSGALVTTVYDIRWSLIPDGRGGWLLDTGRPHRVGTY